MRSLADVLNQGISEIEAGKAQTLDLIYWFAREAMCDEKPDTILMADVVNELQRRGYGDLMLF